MFSSVQASAKILNDGTQILTSGELSELDLTQYNFKSCGEGIYYRYDNNYKALIIVQPNVPMDSNKESISTMINSSAFADMKNVKLLYIDGCLKFDSDFDKVVENNPDMKTCICHYQKTKNNFENKYNSNNISFNTIPNEFYFLNHKKSGEVDFYGVLGDYRNLIDNVVGYKGCRMFKDNRVLIKTSSISETKATDTPSTSTPVIIKEIKEYEVIEEEPKFEKSGKSHIEIEENGVVTEVKASKEIPVLDESLKDVYYPNDEKKIEEDKKNDVATETPKATETPISTSTATTTTKDETQKPTGDSKNILAVFGLGLVGVFTCNKLKKRI